MIADTKLQKPVAAPLRELVTFVICSYNGEDSLGPTLAGLLALDTGCRIVLLDDGSTDGTVALVRKRFPSVDVISFGKNRGVSYGRKRAIEETRTPYLMLMDNDVVFAAGCIERLLARVRANPHALSCRPRLVYADRPEIIYQDASNLHYLALAADQRRERPVGEGLLPPLRQTVGGGMMLLNCAVVRDLGNFDENYLFGSSDFELDVRARLLGYVVLQDPNAIAYHEARLGGLRRVTGQLYNRRRLIMICYSARSLALLAPALLLFELLVFLMCVTEGYSRQYWDALKLLKATFPDIRARRRQLQSRSERLGDRVILSGGRISITGRMAGSRFIVRGSGILSAIFGAYWRIVGPFIPGHDDVPKLVYEFPEGSQP